MRVIFMGTPEFSVESLDLLNKEHEVVGVFTKPDKVNKRGNKIRYSPVKKYAIDNNLDVYQPKSVKSEDTIALVEGLDPDIIVVVAYGKILPKQLIDIPKFKTINIHASLLPKYRGAAPLQYSIINGEKKTGVTVMYIEPKLDAGDMILKKETKIKEDDNLETIHDRLSILGRKALKEALDLIKDGKVKAISQDDSKATYAKPISKKDAMINWDMTKEDLFNFVRGLNPFPTAYSFLNKKRFKIYEVKKVEITPGEQKLQNGQVIRLIKDKGPLVKVKNGGVILKKVQPANKQKMSGIDAINGKYIKKSDKFKNK
ncbi:MAG: methionyl-tRNA formyltransferase [Fusobacteriota bacterium]